ncbi:MAG: hypothetical protein ACXADL_10380 [Candidatus Thorarchaeota archaeon]
MVKSIEEVMQLLENYTLAWHHWLIVLSLLKLGGSGTKAQIFPVYKKEGFSPHAIENVFKTDIQDLGEALEVEGDINNLTNSAIISLTRDPTFQRFVKKHVKTVVRTLKTRKQ